MKKLDKNKIKKDCFGCGPGGKSCKILTEMLCEKGKCPFYKTKAQYDSDKKRYAPLETEDVRSVRNARRVRCVETGVVYPTIVAAAEDLFLTPAAVSFALSKQRRKAGGLSFEYVG